MLSAYLKGLPDLKEYRSKWVRFTKAEEVEALLDELLAAHEGFEFPESPISLVNYHEHCAL